MESRYSGLIAAERITFPHFSISAAIVAELLGDRYEPRAALGEAALAALA